MSRKSTQCYSDLDRLFRIEAMIAELEAFREAYRHCLGLFEAALGQRRLIVETCNLADIVDEAKRLSAIHTVSGGHRGFDILHVAAALELGAAEFLTFDGNQKRLAESEGLRVPLFEVKWMASPKA